MKNLDARSACSNCSAPKGIFCGLNCAVNRDRNDAMIAALASDARDNGDDRLVATCRIALKSKAGKSRDACAAICADGYLDGGLAPTNTVTMDQIKTLRDEAGAAGDDLQVAWCDLAMAYAEDGDSVGDDLRHPVTGAVITSAYARKVCADVIAEARGELAAGRAG